MLTLVKFMTEVTYVTDFLAQHVSVNVLKKKLVIFCVCGLAIYELNENEKRNLGYQLRFFSNH